MSEYKRNIEIAAGADQVYEYISNPENLPCMVLGVQEAHLGESDLVNVEGIFSGKQANLEANLHLDPDERTMHWSCDGLHNYRGELHVVGDDRESTLSVHLVFEPGAAGEPPASHIEEELSRSLETIKHAAEAVPTRHGYLS